MKLQIFAIKDRAIAAFMQPFFAPSIGGALRAFQDAMNDGSTPMNKHPDDYDLWHLGEWDDQSGEFVCETGLAKDPLPTQLAMGKNMITRGQHEMPNSKNHNL